MKKQLLFLLFSIVTVTMMGRTVTGTVTQASDGDVVIGASVMVKGTQVGTSTDIDGKYSIDVKSDDAVLVFTYVGMNTVTEKVGSRNVVDIVLTENSTVLQEVVVTAMGQVQEKKKLNYAVQALNSDELTAGQSTNFVNTLQGKVAGVQVGMAGGSPNSASQIVIRSISSINNTQNNQPLFVIDGMAISGSATSMADINPNDIETMSVLKGAAASSLYGTEGANGVILITTKSGKAGELKTTASGGWEISNTLNTPHLQKVYGPGSNGFYVSNSAGGWGPRLNSDEQVYDNLGNFLGTGFQQKYDFSVSGGSEKFSAYASVNYLDAEGVVHDDYKKKLGMFLKGEFKLSKTVKALASINYVDTKSRGFGNSMSTIYGWAVNKDMSDYRTLEGYPNWSNRYDDWASLTDSQRINATLSPYYSRYMDDSKTESTRVILNGSLSWEPIKNLVFTAKVSNDRSHSTYDSYTRERFKGDEFTVSLDELKNSALYESYASRMGTYSFTPSRGNKLVIQGLVNYSYDITKDHNVSAFVGGEYTEYNGVEAGIDGTEFILGGNFYSLNNISDNWFSTSNVSLYHTSWNKYGYFGELRYDYKGMVQVSATGRIDTTSRLLQAQKKSYFYPSVTAGVIFSELFNLHNDWFSYGKIRGNWAKVGKDCSNYLFTPSYKKWATFPDGGFSIDPTTAIADKNLQPEMIKTWEIGADLRFFNSKTRLDLAYYSTTADNQIVTVRVSPAAGTILQTRNEGVLENTGVEATLSQDIIQNRDFQWTATLNFSLNRGKVKSLPDGITEIQGGQFGDIFASAYLNGSSTSITGKDYLRTDDGQVICDENGYPKINPTKSVLIGNREPDFLLGLGSNFTWKDLSVSFLVDGRVGGDVANVTSRGLLSNGQAYILENYRNREAIFKGVVEQADGTYAPNTKPIILDQQTISNYFYNVSSNFIEDGSYIRLSYVTVAYDFSKYMKKLGGSNPIKGLKCSLTGRNLFLLTKYTGSDPQIMSGVASGTGSMGIDNYSVPSLRSFNFNVNLTF